MIQFFCFAKAFRVASLANTPKNVLFAVTVHNVDLEANDNDSQFRVFLMRTLSIPPCKINLKNLLSFFLKSFIYEIVTILISYDLIDC